MPIPKVLLPAALIVALAACQNPAGVNGLTVRMSSDRATVDDLHPVAITITVVNRGPREVSMMDPVTVVSCARAIKIEDAVGQQIALPDLNCALVTTAPYLLVPGDSVVIHDAWAGERSDGSHGTARVQPGTYQVIGRIMAEGREIRTEPVVVEVGPSASE
jgi:hypothetical protein